MYYVLISLFKRITNSNYYCMVIQFQINLKYLHTAYTEAYVLCDYVALYNDRQTYFYIFTKYKGAYVLYCYEVTNKGNIILQ